MPQVGLLEKSSLLLLLIILPFFTTFCRSKQDPPKPRIIISTDIGGTDPDDYQSIIHFLMYANLFQTEGLISSPYGAGRTGHLLKMVDLYEKDLPKLQAHAKGFPSANKLRGICKQGAISAAPFQGWSSPSEGSEWIVQCAKRQSDQPLWVLVWGGLEDLAQALHDAPDIEKKIKVYWIGGPNKKWSVNSYAYIAQHHPNLWMIEANATYRGWFLDAESPEELKNDQYYDRFIHGLGALGVEFKKHYRGSIKMGDTPSLAYLMNGNPNDPIGESWGGSFTPINRSSRMIFEGNSSKKDTVAAYAVLEWRFKGPELPIAEDSACFTLKVNNQTWPGYYLGKGIYGVCYSSKKPERSNYITKSKIPELNGQAGEYISIIPWPGKTNRDDYMLGSNWYSDRQEANLFIGEQQGASTVSKYRADFLQDWAERWEWLR